MAFSSPLLRTLVLLFGFTAGSAVHSFEPAPANVPTQIDITFEVYELPRETYNKLSQIEGNKRADDRMLKAVRELAATGAAQLSEHHSVRTRSGQRCTVESVQEVRYATEFDPSNAAPTAFEMRAVGFRAEIDPVLGADLLTIDLTLVPEMCELMGTETTTYTDPKSGEKLTVEQPRFYSRKVATSITCFDGQPRLVGSVGAKGDPEGKTGRMALIFVIATVIQ